MVKQNRVVVELAAIPENVGVARLLAAMVAAQCDFTVAEVDEVKLAVSEAVTNAVIHGYGSPPGGEGVHPVRLEVSLADTTLTVVVADQGRGIDDIGRAMQPAVSSDPERMGLGFCFMESHMDSLQVESAPGRGTRVTMTKRPAAVPLARAEAN